MAQPTDMTWRVFAMWLAETECLGEVQDYLSIFEVLIGFITDRSIMLKTMAVVASLCRSQASCIVLTEHCRVVECVCTVMECCLDDVNTQASASTIVSGVGGERSRTLAGWKYRVRYRVPEDMIKS